MPLDRPETHLAGVPDRPPGLDGLGDEPDTTAMPSILLRRRQLGLLCLLVTVVGRGLNWAVMKFLLREWPPLWARRTAGVGSSVRKRWKLKEVNMALVFVRKSGTPAQPMASPPPSLLSVKDAADYYHVSPQTVRRLIKAGRLKTYRVGRQIRIDLTDIIHCMSPS